MNNPFTWLGDKVKQGVSDLIERNLIKAGERVVARAQQLAPVRTGALRNSIGYVVAINPGGKSVLSIQVRVPYGVYQEFGTRNIPPHPFIRPALNELPRIFGGTLSMDFAGTGGGPGLLASTGAGRRPGYAASHLPGFRPLTARQAAHVQRTLVPGVKKYHKGNVKRARFTVGP